VKDVEKLQNGTQKTQVSELEKELELVRDALKHSQHQLSSINSKGICHTDERNCAYIMKNAPVAVMITNIDGLIKYVNPKFEEVSGYQLHEVVGKNPHILKSGETNNQAYEELWQTIKEGKQWTGVFHNRRKDGELFWERAVITGIKNEQGDVAEFIAIKEDITEIKEAREKLAQERLKIIQQSKMAEVGLLAAGILHEVGNPIAAIRGLICEIKDACLDIDEQKSVYQIVNHQLDQVLNEVDRITGITFDISEFTYTGYTEYELLDVNAMINTTCRLLQYDERWSNTNLQIVLDPELPAIYAIKDHITQVLINLLSNAIHAVNQTSDKNSLVEIFSRYDIAQIQVIVKDNGCGIETKNLPKIFDNFFTSKAPGEGMGLGLAMCKSIINSHRGNIEIASLPGKGTEVCISLPTESQLQLQPET